MPHNATTATRSTICFLRWLPTQYWGSITLAFGPNVVSTTHLGRCPIGVNETAPSFLGLRPRLLWERTFGATSLLLWRRCLGVGLLRLWRRSRSWRLGGWVWTWRRRLRRRLWLYRWTCRE